MCFLVSGFCCVVVLSFRCFWWLIGRHVQTWATMISRHGYRFCSTCRHGQPVCITCRHGQPVCRTRQLGCANACVSGALVRCAVCRRCAARAGRTGQARNGSGRLTWGRVPRGPCPEDPIFRKVPRSFLTFIGIPTDVAWPGGLFTRIPSFYCTAGKWYTVRVFVLETAPPEPTKLKGTYKTRHETLRC